MSQSQQHVRRNAARRPSAPTSPEVRRLEAQVQELLRLSRAQEQRLGELEAQLRLGHFPTHQPNLGIDL